MLLNSRLFCLEELIIAGLYWVYPEMDNENVKVIVTEIWSLTLQKKMSEAVDVAHRLGEPVSGRGSVYHPLSIVLGKRLPLWTASQIFLTLIA